MRAAPVRNVEEWAILVALSLSVTEDGTVSAPVPDLASMVHLSERTVRRRLDGMTAAGIIEKVRPAAGRRAAAYRFVGGSGSPVYGGSTDHETGLVDRSAGQGSGSPVYQTGLRPVEGSGSPVYDLPYVVGEEASSKDDAEEQNHVEVGAAALDRSSIEGHDSSITTAEGVTPRHTEGIPWTEVHLLRSWFSIEKAEQVQAWQAAWSTAMNVASDYDPQAHLVSYLTRCREQERPPQPGLWLRFLIEDRQKFKVTMGDTARRLEQERAADGGEGWALRSLTSTPDWSAVGKGDGTQ